MTERAKFPRELGGADKKKRKHNGKEGGGGKNKFLQRERDGRRGGHRERHKRRV